MNTFQTRILMTILLILSLAVTLSLAQVPKTISYQGVLTDASGAVAPDGNYNLTFRLYDVASEGKALWMEEQSVAVSKGIFSVNLGSVVPLNLPFNKAYWLGVTVGTGPELTPRIPLTSSGYSFRAVYSDSIKDNAVTTAKIADQAVTQEKLAPDVSLPPGGEAGGDLTGIYPKPMIASGVVNTAKLADNAITSAKIANEAVTMAKIAQAGAKSGQVIKWTGSVWAPGPDETGGGGFTLPYSDSVSVNDPAFKVTNSGNGTGVYGVNSTSGIGVYGQNTYSGNYGYLGSTNYGIFGATVNSNGVGIYGKHNSSGNYGFLGDYEFGVFGMGLGTESIGMYGKHFSSNNYGFLGSDTYGVYGSGWYGVYGKCSSGGNFGHIGSSSFGVYGEHASSGNNGYLGSYNTGVYGYSSSDYGVYGRCSGSNGYGVYGANSINSNYGFLGSQFYGVYGRANSGTGVYGYSANGYGGYFYGNVHVSGTLSKSAGSFKIDHPLDPENKYLYHSFVESPDMKNVYDGVVQLDANGEAWVQLPEYFEALNRGFRYQLTPIGAAMPDLHIAQKISNNRFKIAGGVPGMEVSWQVTGIRQDPYAKAHPILPEVEKTGRERGKYLHPKEYGVSETLGIDYEEQVRFEAEQAKIKAMDEKIRMEQEKISPPKKPIIPKRDGTKR